MDRQQAPLDGAMLCLMDQAHEIDVPIARQNPIQDDVVGPVTLGNHFILPLPSAIEQ